MHKFRKVNWQQPQLRALNLKPVILNSRSVCMDTINDNWMIAKHSNKQIKRITVFVYSSLGWMHLEDVPRILVDRPTCWNLAPFCNTTGLRAGPWPLPLRAYGAEWPPGGPTNEQWYSDTFIYLTSIASVRALLTVKCSPQRVSTALWKHKSTEEILW